MKRPQESCFRELQRRERRTMKKSITDLKDFVAPIQYEVYWKEIEESLTDDLYGWNCGFFRNLFVLAPPIDEIQSEQFMEFLAEKAVIKAEIKRTVDQCVVCSAYERTADERRRREFFFEPLKKAHYYNEFIGVHVIDMSEWASGDGLDCSTDFDRLKTYMSKAQKETRFLLWARTNADGKRLTMSVPGLSFRKIQLPSPSFNQLKSYTSLSLKRNNLCPTENAISVILHDCRGDSCKTDQFKKIDAAVAFLNGQLAENRSRKPTKADVEKLQTMMAWSYIADELPVRKIGF